VKSEAKENAFVLTDATGKQINLACIESKKTDMWIDGLNRIALAMVKDGRDGSYKSVDAKFGEGSLGIRLAPDMRIDSAGTGIVKGMRSDSPANEAGVKVGDTLMRVNDVDVSFGVSSFEDALKLIKAAPRPVVLRFARVEKTAPSTPVKVSGNFLASQDSLECSLGHVHEKYCRGQRSATTDTLSERSRERWRHDTEGS